MPPAGRAARSLERVRDRIRAVAVSERLLSGAAGIGAWLMGAGLIDFTLRLPGWLRLILLFAGAAMLLGAIWRRLLPAIRIRPKLSTVALRLERSELGRARGLKGVLASGVSLAGEPDEGEPDSIRALRAQAAAEADARLADSEPWRIVETATLRRRAVWAAAVGIAAAAIAVMSPTTALTGLSRQLAPLGDAAWPRRFAVQDATGIEVHALGSAVPLRALVTRTNRPLGQTPVTVVYRVTEADGTSIERREPMTPQRVTEMTTSGAAGEAYERLIELPVVVSSDDEPARLEYAFETPDDRTDWARVTLVEQPEITGIAAVVTPPAYASGASGAFLSGEIDLSEAGRARGLIGPVLAGSEVRLTAQLNKPAEPAQAEPLREIESGEVPAGVSITIEGASASVAWRAVRSARLSLGVRDRFGVESVEDEVVRVEVVEDAPPRSTVIVPARDESVLATAVVDVEAEGRDDVALAWVALEYERATVPSGSEGAEPEGDGERVELVRVGSSETRASAAWRLDLGPLGLRPGDVLEVFGTAADTFERDGVSHDIARSDPRRLRIISESELIDEVLAELASVRRTAIRLDEQQAELSERLAQAREAGEPPAGDEAQRQGNVSESLSAAAESIERASERLERNGLTDESLDRVVRDAAEAADRGARAAEAAASALNEAAQSDSQGGSQGAEQAEGQNEGPDEGQDEQRDEPQNESDQADDEQEAAQDAIKRAEEQADEVRRALEDLARALDRGEDAWSVRRSLEGILSDQAELTGDTASAGAQTVGRDAGELTEQERSILDEIARRQLDIAERTAELLDELEERSEQSAEQDAGQSAAMRAASRRGREQGVAQMLREASRAVAQNRAAEAGRAQEEAEQQLEEMLNDLEQAERQRDAELQRALLSLVETIEGLIRTQESELARLDAGGDDLAGGMERLHRNTLAALDEADRDAATAAVALPLGEAGAAQSAAIVVLRSGGDDLLEARDAETRSLDRLQRALEVAREALEDAERREQDRKRQELQSAYRAALEAQVSITAETAGFAGRDLSRRERATLRELGSREDALGAQLSAVRESFPELTEARIFDFSHTRLDASLARVGGALGAGDAGAGVALDQASVERVLRGLIEALDPPEQNDEQDFSQGGGGGGGQSGGPQPLIPQLAELQMLRTLQSDIYDRTRAIEDAGVSGEIVDRIGAEQRELAEQARVLLDSLQQQQGGGG